MPSEIVTIAINDLFVPDWNPRKLIKEAPLQDLMGYLKAGKIVPKLWVWKGNGQAPFAVISGQRRLLACKRLGYTELEVEVFDIPLEEAKDLAISSNQDDEMHWWERCKSIAEREKAYSGSQRSLAPTLGVDPATVNRSVRIFGALTPSAIAIFDAQCITEGSTYDPSLRVALVLTTLKNPELVEKALKVAVDHKMAEGQAKSLVKHIQAGNPPETFGSAPKTPKQPKPKPGLPSDEVLAKVAELAEAVGFAKGRGEDPTPTQKQLDALLVEIKTASLPIASTTQTPKPLMTHLAEAQTRLTQPSLPGEPANIFVELLAGIYVVHQIDAKIKKGEKVTFWDVVILLFRDLLHILGWLSKHGFKLIWHILKWVGKQLKESVKTLFKSNHKKGFLAKAGRAVQLIVSLAILGFFGWFAWDVYSHGIFHPFRVIVSKLHSPQAGPMPIAPITQQAAASPTVQAQPVTVAEVEPKKSSKPNSPTPQPTPLVAAAIPTIQPTPTVQKNDVAGQIVGSVAKQAGTDVAGDVAKKLFGL